MKPSSRHHQHDASHRKLELTVSEAFELHGVLGENPRKADDNDDRTVKVNPIPVPIRANDRLLRSIDSPSFTSGQCANGTLRPGLWVLDPELNLSDDRVGFLSQLAQLCIQADLHECNHPPCVRGYEAMDKYAPECGWDPFRKWALVAMSCQESMPHAHKISRAHTHLARAASGCFRILKTCLEPVNREELLATFLDGQEDPDARIGLSGVISIIHWMVGIQSRAGTAAMDLRQWNHLFTPSKYSLPEVQSAQSEILKSEVCMNRLWNLVNISDRKENELPGIMAALMKKQELFAQGEHGHCTPSKCQEAHMDTARVVQLHKCPGKDCKQTIFPLELLPSRVGSGKTTSWLCETPSRKKPLLNTRNHPCLAISHVWSDGTGDGGKAKGSVNSCLYKFFSQIAEQLECEAIWWDTVSIPGEPKARSKCVERMQQNYAKAEHTVVHDQYLLNFPWSDDGTPCLAMVLSPWFSRGWTALELAVSNSVKVLFKDPQAGTPIIKDLDLEVLAKSPGSSTRAHWLASTLVRRIRRPIDHVGDIIAILAPRSTSKVRDRTKIATLLAEVPNVEFSEDDETTDQTTERSSEGGNATKRKFSKDVKTMKRLLEYLGKIPYFCLLHGKPTMCESGGFSWCTPTLDDMPVEVLGATHSHDEETIEEGHLLSIDSSGAAWGTWSCRWLEGSDVSTRKIKSYGDNLQAKVKVDLALAAWSRCLLLRPTPSSNDPRALLVKPVSILKDGPTLQCQYVGTVTEEKPDPKDYATSCAIQLGGDTKDIPASSGRRMLATIQEVMKKPDRFTSDHGVVLFHDDATADASPVERAAATTLPTCKLTLKLVAWPGNTRARSFCAYPEDLDSKSLILAAEAGKPKAARFLVRNDVRLSRSEELSVGQRLTPEKAARALMHLAKVHAELSLTPEAIRMYRMAIKLLSGRLDVEDEDRQKLDLESARLALGRAYNSRQHIMKDNTHEAKELFELVIVQCKSRRASKRQSYNKWKCGERPSGALPSSQHQGERATKWLVLELEAISELVRLAIARWDFKAAGHEYQKCMQRFEAPYITDEFEGFEMPWKWRKTEKAETKRRLEKEAAKSYHFVARRLDCLFRRDNILRLVTKLHTGMCYTLQTDLAKAEGDLREAVDDLACHSGQRPHLSNVHATYTPGIDRDALVALTQYRLGFVLLQQHKFDDAKKAFEEAQRLVLRQTHGTCGSRELHHAISIALSELHLEKPEPSPSEAIELLNAVLRDDKQPAPTDGQRRFSIAADINFTMATYAVSRSIEQPTPDDGQSRLAIAAKINIAKALHADRDDKGAEATCQEALHMIRGLKSHVPQHDMDEALATEFLGTLALKQAKQKNARGSKENNFCLQKALALTELSLKILEVVEGPGCMLYLHATSSLAKVHCKLLNFQKAEKLYGQTLEGYVSIVGEFSPHTMLIHLNLGRLHLVQNNYETAEEHCIKAQDGYPKVIGSCNRRTVMTTLTLGDIYFKRFKFTKATDMYRRAHQSCEDKCKRDQLQWFREKLEEVTEKLARSYTTLGGPRNVKLALNMYQKRLQQLESEGRKESQAGLRTMVNLGNLWRQGKKFEKASELIREAYIEFKQLKETSDDWGDWDDSGMFEAKLRFGELILDWQQADENETFGLEHGDPEELLRSAKDGLEKTLGKNDLLTIEATTALGEICAGDEGAELLQRALKSYEGLSKYAPETIRVMDQLIKHWRENDRYRAEEMKKKKWAALRKGYGEDTAVAIMKMTDPRRDNLYFAAPDEPDDEDEAEADKGDRAPDEGTDVDVDDEAEYASDVESYDSALSDYEEVAQRMHGPEGFRGSVVAFRGAFGAHSGRRPRGAYRLEGASASKGPDHHPGGSGGSGGPPAAGGSGGSAGSGGAGHSRGFGNSGGSAGFGGSAGSAGAGGSRGFGSSGGSGGPAGSAGSAGPGGSAGSSGGAGDTNGNTGSSGTRGFSGSGGAPGAHDSGNSGQTSRQDPRGSPDPEAPQSITGNSRQLGDRSGPGGPKTTSRGISRDPNDRGPIRSEHLDSDDDTKGPDDPGNPTDGSEIGGPAERRVGSSVPGSEGEHSDRGSRDATNGYNDPSNSDGWETDDDSNELNSPTSPGSGNLMNESDRPHESDDGQSRDGVSTRGHSRLNSQDSRQSRDSQDEMAARRSPSPQLPPESPLGGITSDRMISPQREPSTPLIDWLSPTNALQGQQQQQHRQHQESDSSEAFGPREPPKHMGGSDRGQVIQPVSHDPDAQYHWNDHFGLSDRIPASPGVSERVKSPSNESYANSEKYGSDGSIPEAQYEDRHPDDLDSEQSNAGCPDSENPEPESYDSWQPYPGRYGPGYPEPGHPYLGHHDHRYPNSGHLEPNRSEHENSDPERFGFGHSSHGQPNLEPPQNETFDHGRLDYRGQSEPIQSGYEQQYDNYQQPSYGGYSGTDQSGYEQTPRYEEQPDLEQPDGQYFNTDQVGYHENGHNHMDTSEYETPSDNEDGYNEERRFQGLDVANEEFDRGYRDRFGAMERGEQHAEQDHIQEATETQDWPDATNRSLFGRLQEPEDPNTPGEEVGPRHLSLFDSGNSDGAILNDSDEVQGANGFDFPRSQAPTHFSERFGDNTFRSNGGQESENHEAFRHAPERWGGMQDEPHYHGDQSNHGQIGHDERATWGEEDPTPDPEQPGYPSASWGSNMMGNHEEYGNEVGESPIYDRGPERYEDYDRSSETGESAGYGADPGYHEIPGDNEAPDEDDSGSYVDAYTGNADVNSWHPLYGQDFGHTGGSGDEGYSAYGSGGEGSDTYAAEGGGGAYSDGDDGAYAPEGDGVW